jgi:hypothetical protein
MRTARSVQQGRAPLYTDARHCTATGVPIALFEAGPRTLEANAHQARQTDSAVRHRKATPVAALTLWDLLGLGAPCDATAVAARCAAI